MDMVSLTLTQTELTLAVQSQDVSQVRRLIEGGATVDSTDTYGQTALHWAAKEDSVEVVEMLLDAGASPNLQDVDGDTALHNAVKNSNSQVCVALMVKGARGDMRNKSGSSPLDVARGAGNQKLVDQLEQAIARARAVRPSLWARLLGWLSGGQNRQNGPKPRVKFLREYQKPSPMPGLTNTYREYRAPQKAAALEFLEATPVDEPLVYVVVETPEGTLCKDKTGLYEE